MNAAAFALFDEAAASWAAWMFEMAWQVTLLVILLAAISMPLRRRSATFLYALWLLIVVRLLLPPGFAFPTGWGWWLRPGQAAVSAPEAPAAMPVVDPVTGSGHGVDASVNRHVERSRPAAETPGALSLSALLMFGWLGIVAARCAMLLAAALQVRAWVARARPIRDPAVVALFGESRRRVGVNRAVELRNSESCATPLVVGVRRPVLLLPSSVLRRLDTHQLRAVLIHELYHVKRWDGAVNLVQGLLGAVYFFHPLVWWANRRIRQFREDACDERTVAALGGRRKPYGEAIFKIAEILGYAAPPLALGVLDSKAPLKQRLTRILDPGLPAARTLGWRSGLAVIAAGAILIPSGARRVSTAEPPLARREFANAANETTPRPPEDEVGPAARAADVFHPGTVHEPAMGPGDLDRLLAELASGDRPRAEEAFDRLIDGIGGHSPSDPRALGALAGQLAVPRHRAAAARALAAAGPGAEPAVLRTLDTSDEATRTAIYGVLGKIGTGACVFALQQALLERSESEQLLAKRALDAVYERVRALPAERGSPVNSHRIFQQQESSAGL